MIVGARQRPVFVIISVAAEEGGKGTPASNLSRCIAAVRWSGGADRYWFGSQLIMEHLPFLQKLVIPQLTNFPETEMFSQVTSRDVQNTMMGFCFLLGTIQLSLACVMNIVYKAGKKNISLLADVGWLLDILALYQVILMLVFSKEIDTSLAFSTVGVGFALVLVFGNQGPGVKFGDGLKTGLAGFLPTFLNTISCFSNTMSYIRLYAVGMAGFAIGNSFDTMAEGVFRSAPLLVGVIGFLFVVLIGHSLNLVMSLLSVIVHGIRLNILEFSNQLGMSGQDTNMIRSEKR
jgi:V/A-type H+-transporting ATPase subunit I